MTALQQEVVNTAKAELKKHDVFRVCLDELPDDHEIIEKGIERVADALVIDTLYWEKDGI
jgi:hypothetical protein